MMIMIMIMAINIGNKMTVVMMVAVVVTMVIKMTAITMMHYFPPFCLNLIG